MERGEKGVKKEQVKLATRIPVKCPLTEINKFLMCELCSGYLVDATAIIECQHTFCKSCILHYLDSNSYCPICDVQLNKAKPHLSLRADTILQKMVYKMVPGLFVTEVRRRTEFAKKKCGSDGKKKDSHNSTDKSAADCEGVSAILEDTEDLCVLSLDDSVSLSLEYLKSPSKEEEGKDGKAGSGGGKKGAGDNKANDRRYLQCPAAVSVGLLKKFIRQKYGLSEDYRVDLLYNGDGDNNLENDLTLLDLAFMFKWNKAEPMCFHYRIFDKPVKATLVHPGWKRPAHSMMDEPPDDEGSSGQREDSMKSSGTPSKLARISEASSGATSGSGSSGGNSGSSQNSRKKSGESREEKALDSDVMEIEEVEEEVEEDEENEKPGKKSKKKKGRSRSRSGDVVVEKEGGKGGKRGLKLTLSKKYGIKQTRSCSKTSEGGVEGVKITLPKAVLQGKSSSKKSPKKSVSSSGEEFSPSSSESSPCSSPTRVGGSSSSGSGSCGSKEGSSSLASLKISIGKHKITTSPTHTHHHHRHHKHKHHKHKKDKNKDRETRHSRRQSSANAASKISSLAKSQVQTQEQPEQSSVQLSGEKKGKMMTRADTGPALPASKSDKSESSSRSAKAEVGQKLSHQAGTANKQPSGTLPPCKSKPPLLTSTVVKDGLKNMVGTLKNGSEAGTSARTSPVVLANQSSSSSSSQAANHTSSATLGEKDTGSVSRGGGGGNNNAGAGLVPESVQLQVPKSVTLIPVNPNAPMASHKLSRNVDKGRTGNSTTFTHPITNKSLHQITVTEVPPPDNKSGPTPTSSTTGTTTTNNNSGNTGGSGAAGPNPLPHLDKALSSPSKQFNGPGSMEITKIYCDNPQTKPFDIGNKKLKERKCLDITISPSPLSVSGGLSKSGRKILEETLTYGSKVSNLNAQSQLKSRPPSSNKVMNVSQIQQVPPTLRTSSAPSKGESATKQRKSSLSIEPAKAGVTSFPEIPKANPSRKGIANLDSSIAIYEVNSIQHRTPTPPKDKGIVVTPVGSAGPSGKSQHHQPTAQQKSLGKRAFESVSAPGSQLKQTLQHGSGNKKSPGPERKREKLGGSGHHDSPLDLSGKSSRSPTDNRPTTPQQSPLPSSRPKSTSPSERKAKAHGGSSSSSSTSPSTPHHNLQSSPAHNPTNAQSIHNIAHSLAHKHQQQSRESRPQKSASPATTGPSKSHVSPGHHLNIPNQNPLTHSRSPPVIPIPSPSPPGPFNPLRNLLTLSDAAMHMRNMQNSAINMNHFAGYCANPSSAALAAAVAAGVFPPPTGTPGSALSPPLGAGIIPGLSAQSQFRHKAASMPMGSSGLGKGGLMSPGSVGVPGWPQSLQMNMGRGMVPSLGGSLVGPGPNPMASPPLSNPLSNLYNSLAAASTAANLMTPTTSTNPNQSAPQRAPPQLRIPNHSPSGERTSSVAPKNPNKSSPAPSLHSHQQHHHHQPPATVSSKSAPSSSSSNPNNGASSHAPRSSSLPTPSPTPLQTPSRSSKLNGMNSGSISSIANSLLEQRTASAAAAHTFTAPSSLKPVTKSQSQTLKDAIPNSMKISNFLPSSSPSKQGNDQAMITSSSSSSLAKMFSTLPPLMRPQSPPTTTIPPLSKPDINPLSLKTFVDSPSNSLSLSAPPATPFTFTLTPPTCTESVTKTASLSPTKTSSSSSFTSPKASMSDTKKPQSPTTIANPQPFSDEMKGGDLCLYNASETIVKSSVSPPNRNLQAVNQAVRHIPNPSLLFNRSQQSSVGSQLLPASEIARDNSIKPKSPTTLLTSFHHQLSKETTIISPEPASTQPIKDDSLKILSGEGQGEEKVLIQSQKSPQAEQVNPSERRAVEEEVLGTDIKKVQIPERESCSIGVKVETLLPPPLQEAKVEKSEIKEEDVVAKVTVATVSPPPHLKRVAQIPAIVETKPPRIVLSAAEIFGAKAPEPIPPKPADQPPAPTVPVMDTVQAPLEGIPETLALETPEEDNASGVVITEPKVEVSQTVPGVTIFPEVVKPPEIEGEKVCELITHVVKSVPLVAESMEEASAVVPEGGEEEKLLGNVERINESMELGLEVEEKESALETIHPLPQENSLTIQEEAEKEEEELPDIDSEPEGSPAKLAEQLIESQESVREAVFSEVAEIREQAETCVEPRRSPEGEIQDTSDGNPVGAGEEEDLNADSVVVQNAATQEFLAEVGGEDEESNESSNVPEDVPHIPAEQEENDELCLSGDGDSNVTGALSTESRSVPAYDANENSDDLIIDPKAVEAEPDAPSCTSAASTSDENNSIELNSDNANPSPIVILNNSNDGDAARSCGSVEGKIQPTLSFSGLTRTIPQVSDLQPIGAECEGPILEQESLSIDLGDSQSHDAEAVSNVPPSHLQLSSDIVADEPMEIDTELVEDSVPVSEMEEEKEDNPVSSDSVQEVPAEAQLVAAEQESSSRKIDITSAEDGNEEDQGEEEEKRLLESRMEESGEESHLENLDILLETSDSAESELTLMESGNVEETSQGPPAQSVSDALREEEHLLEEEQVDESTLETDDDAFEASAENKIETQDSGSSSLLVDLNPPSGDLGLSNGSQDLAFVLAPEEDVSIQSENLGENDMVEGTEPDLVPSEPATDSVTLEENPGQSVEETETKEEESDSLESDNFKDVVMPNMDAMTDPPEELTQDSLAVAFREDELIPLEPAHHNHNNSPPTMSSGIAEEDEGNDNGIMMRHEEDLVSIPQFNPSQSPPTPPTSHTPEPFPLPALQVLEGIVKGGEKVGEEIIGTKPEEPATDFHGETNEITKDASSPIPSNNHVHHHHDTPPRPQPPSPPIQLEVKKMDNLEKVAAGFLATAATTINNNNNNNNNSFPGGSVGVVSCDIPIATATTTA